MKILLVGGSASSKSTYAEKLALSLNVHKRYYLATMRPYDEECLKKIEKHKNQREGGNFITLEQYSDVGSLSIEHDSCVLLECVCNLCANEMFDEHGNMRDCVDKIVSDIEKLASKCEHLIVVTNDVGSDVYINYSEETKEYVKAVGNINSRLAASFDCVYELVCSIPIVLKGELLI